MKQLHWTVSSGSITPDSSAASAFDILIVDPGGDAEEIIARVKDLGLNVRQILITHGHFDHVLAARAVKKATGAKIAIHRKDRWLYRITPVQSKLFCVLLR